MDKIAQYRNGKTANVGDQVIAVWSEQTINLAASAVVLKLPHPWNDREEPKVVVAIISDCLCQGQNRVVSVPAEDLILMEDVFSRKPQ